MYIKYSTCSAVQIRGTQSLTLALQRALADGRATEPHCLRCKVGHRDRRSGKVAMAGGRPGWAPVGAGRDLPELKRGALHLWPITVQLLDLPRCWAGCESQVRVSA